jgi:hypothetical protein
MPANPVCKAPCNHYLANEIALTLSQAEDALLELTSDQVDAMYPADGPRPA